MKFNPTTDYYGMDISQEENRVIWNYWEFIKNLVTLSSPANMQKEIIGLGAAADEMIIDFESYYTFNTQCYLDNGLLNSNQISKLNLLDKFFEDRAVDFFNDDYLESHPDWEKVREMAKNLLKTLGYDNLKIEIEQSTKESTSSKGKSLLIEGIKTRLKKKNSK